MECANRTLIIIQYLFPAAHDFLYVIHRYKWQCKWDDKRWSHTHTNTLTFLSSPIVANWSPFGEIVMQRGKVLFFTNSNRSVSNLDSKLTQVGVWNSFFVPDQYSIIPISSTETTTSNLGLYWKKNIQVTAHLQREKFLSNIIHVEMMILCLC